MDNNGENTMHDMIPGAFGTQKLDKKMELNKDMSILNGDTSHDDLTKHLESGEHNG